MCHDLKDAIAKLERGQYIMIREGTAARNLEALVPLLNEKYGSRCLLCTDDAFPTRVPARRGPVRSRSSSTEVSSASPCARGQAKLSAAMRGIPASSATS